MKVADEHRQNLVELEDRARPAVRKEQGHGVGIAAAVVHKVQLNAVDRESVLLHLIEFGLRCTPIELVRLVERKKC